MATNVGDLVVKLGADTREFESAMGRVTGPQSALGRLGPIAGKAALAAGAAIAGFGAKGIADFTALDTSMREVFTLLPGITQDAMDDMTAEVLAFSREFGKLPSEVVPALYSAISAGVPVDNVFEFMRVATELSVGGVADLNVAVDGLTSVVNGYGAEVITVNEVSDIMFTAVKNGKTTVDELAGAIGTVVPIAADAGVGFDQVAAAIAAMTAQGLSTDEATTALRAMLVELTDGGSAVSERFATITGTTFPEFIAAGGDLGGALAILRGDTDETGERMTDVFGNIRGGLAATVLSGESGQEAFSSSLDEMGNSAGATREAFDTMDEGIQASWNRLKAGFATLSAEVGQKLGPMFQEGVDWVVDVGMPALRDGVLAAFTAIQGFTETLTGVWNRYQTDSDGIFAAVRGFVEAFAGAVGAAFRLIQTVWKTVLKPTWDAIEPLVMGVLNAVVPSVTTSFQAIEGVLNALSALMRGDFKLAWEELQGVVTTITEGIQAVLIELWNGISAFLDERFDAIKQAASDRWNEMTAIIQGISEGLREWIQEFWNGLKAWLGGLFGDIATNAAIHWANVVGAIKGAFDGLAAFVQGIFNEVLAVIQGVIDGVMAAAQTAMDFVNRLLGRAETAEAAAARSAAVVNQAEADMAAAREREAARVAALGAEDTPPGSTAGPGGGIRLPHEELNIPGMALGGIVTGPMRALVGEAGPEAIIPLARLDRMIASAVGMNGGSQTVIVELDGRTIMEAVAPRMVDTLRLRTGVAGL